MRNWQGIAAIGLALVFGARETAGQVTWRRSFGGYGSDVAKSVRTTAEGNYIVCGSTGSFGAGGGDVYLALLDLNGELIWSHTFGGPGVEQGNCVRQTADGGFIIAGLTNSFGAGGYDGYVVKTDANGVEEWSQAYGGGDWDVFSSVEVTDDGDFILAGSTYSQGAGNEDGWVSSITEAGAVLWQVTYGTTDKQFLKDIAIVDAAGYVAVGGTGEGADSDAWLLRLDLSGQLMWSAVSGGDSLDYAVDVVPTLDGGFSVVGTTESYSEWTEMYHYKLDASGVFQWYFHWGQTGDQEANEHLELDDGRLVSICYNRAVGNGGADYFLLTTDPDGNFVQAPSYGGTEDEVGFSLDKGVDGGFLLAGSTASWGAGPSDVFLIKTDDMGQTASTDVIEDFDALTANFHAAEHGAFIWPSVVDPTGSVTISAPWEINSCAVFSATGADVYVRSRTNGRSVTLWLDGHVDSGVYTVICSVSSSIWTGRFLVVGGL